MGGVDFELECLLLANVGLFTKKMYIVEYHNLREHITIHLKASAYSYLASILLLYAASF